VFPRTARGSGSPRPCCFPAAGRPIATDSNIPVSTISPLASALTAAGTAGPELKVLTGVNHLLHMPGTQDNDPVLAPSVVAALKAWAQPFATTG
jgi:hypothetical protein